MSQPLMSDVGRVLIVSLVVSLALTACGDTRGQSTTVDIRPVIPTSSETVDGGVSILFWNAMAIEGATAGMHDGYQACVHPDLGVSVFDIDRFGTLVNPAFDAGYKAGSAAIAHGCAALVEDYAASAELPGGDAQHRLATVGASYDTLDAHPDFGKGFDVGEAIGVSIDCDLAGFTAASPPERWRSDYASEFQSGYEAGLNEAAVACADETS